MHTLMMVVGGLVALGIFVLAAVLLGRRVADGARVFIWPWLVASVVNMLIGIYWASVPFSVEAACAGRRIRCAGGRGLVRGAAVCVRADPRV